MVPKPITLDGRTGTILYLDAQWHPVPPELAVVARVLFDDGATLFLQTGRDEALKFDPDQLRDAKGRWTSGGLTTDLGNVYLHGTAQAFLDDIIKNGLSGEHTGRIHSYDAMRPRLVGKPVGDVGHVYMTTDEAEARRYAESAATELAYGKGENRIPPTMQDIVYSEELPEAERQALRYESGTEVGGGMPCVVTITLPPHIVKQLRKDKKSDILTPWNRATPLRSKVARSYKGTIKPEWITSISYQTKDIATGVETWHTIKPSEWKAPPPTRLPHQPKELKAAAEGQTFYIALVLEVQSIAEKYDPAQPRDKQGRWVDEDNVTHVGDEVELYHGTSRTRANKILKEGLKIRAVRKPTMGGDPESSRNYIWLAKKPEGAKSYSEMHQHPVVLRVRLPRKLYEKLKLHQSGPVSVWSKEPIPAKQIKVLESATKIQEGLGGLTQKFDAAKHPRGEDGRFIEATAPRIFNRAEEVVQYNSWGETKWAWRITPEEAKFGGKVGEPGGKLLTGEPIPREALPKTLYHVTTNAPAVEASGVLLGLLESGGLGGGQAQGVSFTSSPEDAHVIQRELRRAIQIARGDVDIDAIERWAREDEKEAGLPEGTLERAVKEAMYGWEGNQGSLTRTHTWDDTKPEGERYVAGPAPTGAEYDRIRRSLVKDAFNAYLNSRESTAAKALGQPEWPYSVPILKNPLLFGRQEHLAKLNPDDVRTIEVPSANIPEGALVTTGSDKFLHEVRTYSDVPVTNALYHRRLKFDPAQPRDKEGQWTKGAGGTRNEARAALQKAVGGEIPVGVDDHPVAIRAAHDIAAVLTEMRGKGYDMPTEIEVRAQARKSPSGEAEDRGLLVINVPDQLPDDVSLDQAYAAAYGGKIAVVEDGELKGEVQKFVGTTFRDLVIHEMGHINRQGVPRTPYISSRSSPEERKEAEESAKAFGEEMAANREYEREARRSVSEYAATNPDEFVAETFTMLYNGEVLPAKTMQIYKALRGAPIR